DRAAVLPPAAATGETAPHRPAPADRYDAQEPLASSARGVVAAGTGRRSLAAGDRRCACGGGAWRGAAARADEWQVLRGPRHERAGGELPGGGARARRAALPLPGRGDRRRAGPLPE